MSDPASIRPLIDQLLARFESREEALMILTDLVVLVAAADDEIDDAEKDALTASLQAMLESDVAPLLVRLVVEESRDRVFSVGTSESAKTIGEALGGRGVAEEGLRLALAIVASSEGISEVERERIALVAAAAGVPDEQLGALAAEFAAA